VDQMSRLAPFAILFATLGLGAQAHAAETNVSTPLSAVDLALIDRVTWGVNESTATEFQVLGRDRWLDRQLHPGAKDKLPAAAQAQIAAMPITTQPVTEFAWSLSAQQRAANQIQDPEQKKASQQAYQQTFQQTMNELGKQAATRSLLRDLSRPVAREDDLVLVQPLQRPSVQGQRPHDGRRL
jgi:Protein of unknown function (DUF1800)